jgi:peptide/nickel transport system permease protein
LLESDLLHYYKRDKVAIVSSLIFFILAVMALFSPWIAPFYPYYLTQIDLMGDFLRDVFNPRLYKD